MGSDEVPPTELSGSASSGAPSSHSRLSVWQPGVSDLYYHEARERSLWQIARAERLSGRALTLVQVAFAVLAATGVVLSVLESSPSDWPVRWGLTLLAAVGWASLMSLLALLVGVERGPSMDEMKKLIERMPQGESQGFVVRCLADAYKSAEERNSPLVAAQSALILLAVAGLILEVVAAIFLVLETGIETV